jgi:phosphatidylglycerol lysyltransferase
MHVLRDVLPLHLIRGTQTATVLAGFCLILLADGLRKRRRRALQITVVLLFLSSLLHLAKGLDFEEAVAAAGLAFGLLLHHRAFSIGSVGPAPRRVLLRITAFGLLYYSYVLVGFISLRRAIRPAPSLLGVSLEPVRLLIGDPLYHYMSGQAQWFGRSLSLVGSAAVLYTAFQLLRPLVPRRTATSVERQRARDVVQQHGSDTLSYFSLQDGRSYFFDDPGAAFLSYRLWGTVALVAGDPVGPAHRFPALLQSFLDYTHDNAIDVCFLGVTRRFEHLYDSFGFKTLKIGEEALLDLPTFRIDLLKRKVRRAARHVEELGIQAETYRRDTVPERILAQMHDISRAWVELNGGRERGFSMTLGRLPRTEDGDCEMTVALEGDKVWGYLSMVPAYDGNAWSLDSMRRRSDCPNGLMEYLVIRTAEAYRDRGFRTLSLNFATLSNCQDDIDSRVLNATRRFLYENLSSVYQLKSLEQFNGKFQPRWQSRYLAYREVLKFPKLAIAIAQSEDPIRLPSPGALIRRQRI